VRNNGESTALTHFLKKIWHFLSLTGWLYIKTWGRIINRVTDFSHD